MAVVHNLVEKLCVSFAWKIMYYSIKGLSSYH